MLLRPAVSLLTLLVLSSCAITPKESVELSTTVGRDISVVRASHRELATTLFGRMRGDVNRFVDNVYAPYQIQFVLARQKERQQAGDNENLFSVLERAVREPDNTQAQKDAVDIMQAIVETIHEDVEDYRKVRLEPIEQQQTTVLADIEKVYDQIERGNATVTAHLASIVKVHDAQDEILDAADLQGLREKIGVTLSKASDKVAGFVDKAQRVDGSLSDAKKKLDELTSKLDELTRSDNPAAQPIARKE